MSNDNNKNLLNEEWLYDLIIPKVLEANKLAGWNYDISGIEPYQIGKYSADITGHYGWHQDIGDGQMSKRKVSITVQLSDPSEYEGGD